MTDQVRPLGNSILVRQDPKKEKLGSGLLYATQGAEEFPNTGTIVAVGPGKVNDHGVRVPLDPGLVPGARVMFERRPNSALEPDWREGNKPEWRDLLMLDEEHIIGIIEEEAQ